MNPLRAFVRQEPIPDIGGGVAVAPPEPRRSRNPLAQFVAQEPVEGVSVEPVRMPREMPDVHTRPDAPRGGLGPIREEIRTPPEGGIPPPPPEGPGFVRQAIAQLRLAGETIAQKGERIGQYDRPLGREPTLEEQTQANPLTMTREGLDTEQQIAAHSGPAAQAVGMAANLPAMATDPVSLAAGIAGGGPVVAFMRSPLVRAFTGKLAQRIGQKAAGEVMATLETTGVAGASTGLDVLAHGGSPEEALAAARTGALLFGFGRAAVGVGKVVASLRSHGDPIPGPTSPSGASDAVVAPGMTEAVETPQRADSGQVPGDGVPPVADPVAVRGEPVPDAQNPPSPPPTIPDVVAAPSRPRHDDGASPASPDPAPVDAAGQGVARPGTARREPWEMTRGEYVEDAAQRVSGQTAGKTRKLAATYHKIKTREAVEQGRPVPPEVLAEYPDLKRLANAPQRPIVPAAQGPGPPPGGRATPAQRLQTPEPPASTQKTPDSPTTTATNVQQPSRAKEPWEMTGQELLGLRDKVRSGEHPKLDIHTTRRDAFVEYKRVSAIEDAGSKHAWDSMGARDAERVHRREVEAALRQGRPVPPEVLADYPDLKPKEPPRAQPEAEAVHGRLQKPPAADEGRLRPEAEGQEVVPVQRAVPAEQGAVGPYFRQYTGTIGRYEIGPIETPTGTKFGVWVKGEERAGHIASFNGRDEAVRFMQSQTEADALSTAKVPPSPQSQKPRGADKSPVAPIKDENVPPVPRNEMDHGAKDKPPRGLIPHTVTIENTATKKRTEMVVNAKDAADARKRARANGIDGRIVGVKAGGPSESPPAVAAPSPPKSAQPEMTGAAPKASASESPKATAPAPAESPRGPDPTTPPPSSTRPTQEVKASGESTPRVTSARKEWTARDRELMGNDTLPSPETHSWMQALDEARARGIPAKAQRIAAEVNEKPRALSDTETAGVVEAMADLKNQHAERLAKLDKADPAEAASLSAEAARIEDEFDALSTAVRSSGTEKGRALAAQKLTLDQDFSLVSVKARAKAAKGGKALTEAESAKLTEATAKLADATKRVTELERQVADQMADRAVKRHKAGRKTPATDADVARLMAKAQALLKRGC